jgi:hypothetical protein
MSSNEDMLYYDKYMKYKKKYTDAKLQQQKGGAFMNRVYFMNKEQMIELIDWHGALSESNADDNALKKAGIAVSRYKVFKNVDDLEKSALIDEKAYEIVQSLGYEDKHLTRVARFNPNSSNKKDLIDKTTVHTTNNTFSVKNSSGEKQRYIFTKLIDEKLPVIKLTIDGLLAIPDDNYKYAAFVDVSINGRSANVIRWIIKIDRPVIQDKPNNYHILMGMTMGSNKKGTSNFDEQWDGNKDHESILGNWSHTFLLKWNKEAKDFVNK